MVAKEPKYGRVESDFNLAPPGFPIAKVPRIRSKQFGDLFLLESKRQSAFENVVANVFQGFRNALNWPPRTKLPPKVGVRNRAFAGSRATRDVFVPARN
jgi:hypothetical protein